LTPFFLRTLANLVTSSQLLVGDHTGGVGRVALEVVGYLVGDRGAEVPVQAVVGDVESATLEPTYLRIGEVVILDSVPFLVPMQSLLSLFRPEGVGVVHRAPIHLLVLVHARHPGFLLEIGRNVEDLSF